MDDQNKIIDGKSLAFIHEEQLKQKVKLLNFRPKIVSILVGDDPSSVLYSNIKKNKATDVGIDFELVEFPSTTHYEVVSSFVRQLNEDSSVGGIMMQLPLPEEFLNSHQESDMVEMIDPKKDVDGLKIDSPFLHATVKGIFSLLKEEGIEIKGKTIAVVGATGMVGTPLVKQLKLEGATVLEISSKTEDLKTECLKGEILITSVGQRNLITQDMVKEGAVVLDVGMDVDFENVLPKVSKITPPKGGVGPMTVISLLENVVEATINNLEN